MALMTSFVIVLSMFLTASALDCYSCDDCRSFLSWPTTSKTCRNPAAFLGDLTKQQCIKTVQRDGTVNRGCATQTECSFKELALCSNGGEVGCHICCNSDRCNSASMTTVSMTTVGISSFFAMFYSLF